MPAAPPCSAQATVEDLYQQLQDKEQEVAGAGLGFSQAQQELQECQDHLAALTSEVQELQQELQVGALCHGLLCTTGRCVCL
jgi:chromosome segregation ATPase